METFWAAWSFLSVIPSPKNLVYSEETISRSLLYFPVVGLIFGCCAAAIAWLGTYLLPQAVTAFLVCFLTVLLSGGLHLDGLADMADGFWSSRPPERILEIMRDSRIGSMGVLAIIVTLGLRWVVLVSLPASLLWKAALVMPLVGRVCLVLGMAYMPYVRKAGMGSPFYGRLQTPAAFWALFVLLGLSVVVLGGLGLCTVLAVLAALWIFSRYCRKKIGGVTGDTLGASAETMETAFVFFLLIVDALQAKLPGLLI